MYRCLNPRCSAGYRQACRQVYRIPHTHLYQVDTCRHGCLSVCVGPPEPPPPHPQKTRLVGCGRFLFFVRVECAPWLACVVQRRRGKRRATAMCLVVARGSGTWHGARCSRWGRGRWPLAHALTWRVEAARCPSRPLTYLHYTYIYLPRLRDKQVADWLGRKAAPAEVCQERGEGGYLGVCMHPGI